MAIRFKSKVEKRIARIKAERKIRDVADSGATAMGLVLAFVALWIYDWKTFEIHSQYCWLSVSPTIMLAICIFVFGKITMLKNLRR